MDGNRFDRIIQGLAAGGSRRGMLRLLTTLLAAGATLSAQHEMGTDAAKRRHRRKRPRQERHTDQLTTEKKRRKKKKCKPRPKVQTCAGRCGTVRSNCNRPVDCGPCGCQPPCAVCFACDTDTLTCGPNPESVGDPCGDGQVCQADGSCACSGDSCGACRTCGGNGACQGCADCCDGGQCVATCAAGCCSYGTCQSGTGNGACGAIGGVCQSCANPTPVCVDRACAACTSTSQCPAGTRCDGGLCVACDVCHGAGLCTYASVQDALDDFDGPSTVHVCPGTYTENLDLSRDVTLIGEGQGNGPGDTILSGGGGRTLLVRDFLTVLLQDLRITGGVAGENRGGGGGIVNQSTSLTLTDCTITGNTSTFKGGGVTNVATNGNLTMTRCTVSGNSATDPNNQGTGFGDGGGIWTNSPLTLTDCTVSGNTAVHRGGGIFVQPTSTTTLENTDVTGNTAENTATSGGGIFNSPACTVVLSDGSSVSGNTPNNCQGTGNYVDLDGACEA